MYEWKTALKCALSNAPSAAIVFKRQSSIFPNDMVETMDGPLEQCKFSQRVDFFCNGHNLAVSLNQFPDFFPSLPLFIYFCEPLLSNMIQYDLQ